MATASAADASTAVTGLSAARALADAPLLADAMNRTVAAGWGTAETGGAYSYDDQNAFTVNGSQGVITLPGPAESRTVSTAVSATDQTAKTDLGVNSLPTSGRGISVALLARANGGRGYRGLIRVQPAGVTTLAIVRVDGSAGALTPIGDEYTLPAAVTPNSMLTLEFSIAGTDNVELKARAYPAGQPAPAWQVSQTDSTDGRVKAAGTNSIWTYTSGSSQAATVLIDNYTVTAPNATPPPAATPTATTPPPAAPSSSASSSTTPPPAAPSSAASSSAASSSAASSSAASSPTASAASPTPAPAAPAAAAASEFSDSMNRTVSGGWGNANTGGGYSYSNPESFSVNGSVGVIDIPGKGLSRSAATTFTADNQTAAITFGVRSIPTSGNGTSMALVVRDRDGKAYRAVLRVQPAGRTTLAVVRVDGSAANLTPIGSEFVLPTVSANSMLTVEFSTTGSTAVALKARAYPKGQAAPAWQISQTDSSAGRVAGAGVNSIWTYTSGSSQAATVLVDDYKIVPGTVAPTSTTTPPPAPPTTTTTTTPPPTAGGYLAPGLPTGVGGAPVLGSKGYTVPGNARFVSTNGSDSAAGTQAAPYRTVAKAVSAATSGQTIVLFAGTYHESVTVPSGKSLTIQPYNNDVVWFDGSSIVTNWSKNGSNWKVSGWTTEFDASPTYTRGAADSTEANWSFVNPAHPMAAHPDQVWIDNTAQDQVGSLADLGAGKFYVDYASDGLYLGSDPTGHTVRASDLVKAFSIRGSNTALRGFGIARYSPSVPDMGAVTLEQTGDSIDGVVIADSATTGLSVVTTDISVSNVTTVRSGMLGMHSNYADRIKINNLAAIDNNVEHFNSAPVSGGLKVTRTRDVTITNSQFRGNDGPGLWLDESVYDVKVTNSAMIGNTGHGVSVELSAKATLIGNMVKDNGEFGFKINDTSDVKIWNNTFIDNGRPINIVQDARRASNQSTAGHDPRQAFPDPTMTWLNGPVQVRNNIISGTTGNCLLCVEDYSHERSAAQMQVTALGNVYRRPSTSAPTWVVVWSTGAGNPSVFTTLTAFKQSTGQESASLALDGTAAVNANGSPASAVTNAVASVAQAMPADLAAIGQRTAGSKQLGSSLTY